MTKTRFLAAALAAFWLSAPALAQEPGQSYFGIGYGSNRTQGASPYTNTSDDSSAGGLRIYGGHMYGRFGLELGYFDLGEFDVNFTGTKIAEMKTDAITVAGVLVSPIGAGLSIHGKIGMALTRASFTCLQLCGTGSPVLADTDKTDVSGLLGLGLGTQLSQNMMVLLDWMHIGSVKHAISGEAYNDSYDTINLSLRFLF